MNIRQWRGQRWMVLTCLGMGLLGLPLPAEASQMCIDETRFYQHNQAAVRAQWGRQALRKGHRQPAADHLAKALDRARTLEDAGTRAAIFEDFIAPNSGSSGWLIHEVDALVALGETEAVRTVLTSARQAAQELPTGYSALKIRMLTTIATDYIAIGDRATALDLLAQAQQLVSNVQGREIKANILTVIAQGYVAAEEDAIAIKLATQAAQQAEAVTYADPFRRDKTIAPIATVYAEAGAIDQALQLAQSVQQPSYREHAVGRTALAAARLGQMDQANDLVQLLTLAQLKIRTLTDIGLYLIAEDDTEQAQPYLDQVIDVIKTDSYPGSSFTETMIDAGLPERVLAALSAAPANRVKVGGLLDLTRYYRTDDTKAASSSLQQALAATTAIEQDYARQAALDIILELAIEIADYKLAVTAIETLAAQRSGTTTFNPDWAYSSVARAAAQTGQIDVSLDVIERIDPSDDSAIRRTWVDVAVAYAKAGELETAFATAKKTKEAYSSNYALALVGIGLQQRQAGRLEESAITIDQAVQAAKALESSSARIAALNVIALEQVKAGLTAADLLETVLATVREPSTYTNDSLIFHTVVSGWVELGEYDIARRFFDEIAQTQPQNSLWKTLLLERLVQVGNYSDALAMIEARHGSHLELDEMLQIAERYFQAGQSDQAVQILARVYNTAEARPDQLLRIAELYTQVGQTDQVLSVLARAFEVAQTVPGDESKFLQIREDLVVEDTQDRSSLYEEIAVAYGRAGAFDQGQTVVRALQDSDTREQATTRLNCYRDFYQRI
ncbi:MAG: hypothetical protein ACFB2W_27765 [Leptolyngbyaceae cyanobacterium]